MRKGYHWSVFLGWFLVALVFSHLTREVLKESDFNDASRQLITLAVAIIAALVYFFAVRRFRR
jgi:hypothetical protein